MIFPTSNRNATREEFIQAWMDQLGDSREEAEMVCEDYIALKFFRPSDMDAAA